MPLIRPLARPAPSAVHIAFGSLAAGFAAGAGVAGAAVLTGVTGVTGVNGAVLVGTGVDGSVDVAAAC